MASTTQNTTALPNTVSTSGASTPFQKTGSLLPFKKRFKEAQSFAKPCGFSKTNPIEEKMISSEDSKPVLPCAQYGGSQKLNRWSLLWTGNPINQNHDWDRRSTDSSSRISGEPRDEITQSDPQSDVSDDCSEGGWSSSDSLSDFDSCEDDGSQGSRWCSGIFSDSEDEAMDNVD